MEITSIAHLIQTIIAVPLAIGATIACYIQFKMIMDELND
jgi:hypothetical protein